MTATCGMVLLVGAPSLARSCAFGCYRLGAMSKAGRLPDSPRRGDCRHDRFNVLGNPRELTNANNWSFVTLDSEQYPLNLMLFTGMAQEGWEDYFYTSVEEITSPEKALARWAKR